MKQAEHGPIAGRRLNKMFPTKSIFTLILFVLAAQLTGLGCSGDANNNSNSLSSGTHTGSGGSGLPPTTITVVSGNNQLPASGGTTTITVLVTDSRGARTEATFNLTSSSGGNFIIDGTTKGGTIVGTTTGGIFITTFETNGLTNNTEIAATIPGTFLRGSTTININV
jgi:hypothetical protein